ncbi:LptF/LptG family permease [Parvularcula marina]|uniref:LptF/LptG family permease n=1 Tax=Parvularcula marina TaxID=2292771 RepID=A0A371RGA0_9PROT|nr:LptF/LptG family permease [Parvularcula marina]RFB04452.1 LptF/LptG family permease [Parvularcula marina]
MRNPIRLYFTYLVQRTLFGVIGLFAVIWLLVVSVDLVEAMREVGKVEDAGFSEAIRMTLFRTPQLILTLSPFVFLFGTLWAFGQMAKSSEVAVMRAAGLSVWRLVAAPVALSIFAGITTILVFDPVAADLAGRAQTIKNEIRGKKSNMVEPLRDGIWLRQDNGRYAAIVHASGYDTDTQMLSNVTVWRHTEDGVFIDRWDAPTGEVQATNFVLRNVRRTTQHQEKEPIRPVETLPISIDLRTLREDVAKEEALSIWALPEFIRVMSNAGMSTIEYKLRYQDLWSLPIRLAAMALIACAFALGMNARAGGTAALMGVGIATGFALFILSELSTAIARANIVPIIIASWAPSLLAVVFAVTLLLYREDG